MINISLYIFKTDCKLCRLRQKKCTRFPRLGSVLCRSARSAIWHFAVGETKNVQLYDLIICKKHTNRRIPQEAIKITHAPEASSKHVTHSRVGATNEYPTWVLASSLYPHNPHNRPAWAYPFRYQMDWRLVRPSDENLAQSGP
jgi:hypothetical protein